MNHKEGAAYRHYLKVMFVTAGIKRGQPLPDAEAWQLKRSRMIAAIADKHSIDRDRLFDIVFERANCRK